MHNIRVALLDFDGTLVSRDILDVLCQSVDKGEDSRQLNEAFHLGELPGLAALVQRVNFLSGMTKTDIFNILNADNHLMRGSHELMTFFKTHGITTILASGNILPVLEYYQHLLSIDYIVGSHPVMRGDTIVGIDESAFSSATFKLDGIHAILDELQVESSAVIALGDSPSDKGMFDLSQFAIAVNPKGDIANSADAVIGEDLHEAIKILESL